MYRWQDYSCLQAFNCSWLSDVAFIRLVQIVQLAQNGLKMEINYHSEFLLMFQNEPRFPILW